MIQNGAIEVAIAILLFEPKETPNKFYVGLKHACVELLGNICSFNNTHNGTIEINTLRYDAIIKSVIHTMKHPTYCKSNEIQHDGCATLCSVVCIGEPSSSQQQELSLANRRAVMYYGGIPTIFDVLNGYWNDAGICYNAMMALQNMVPMGIKLPITTCRDEIGEAVMNVNGGCESIAKIMFHHRHSPDIQKVGFTFAFKYGLVPNMGTKLITSGIIQFVLDTMLAHPVAVSVQVDGCKVLWNTLGHVSLPSKLFKKIFFDQKGFLAILHALKNHPRDENVQYSAMGALWTPSKTKDDVRLLIVKFDALEIFVRGMSSSSVVRDEAYGVLCHIALSDNPQCISTFLKSDAVPALIRAMKKLPSKITAQSVAKKELISTALARLGLQEPKVGQRTFDFDNEADGYCTIRPPPFDILSLMDQDLSDDNSNAPGWYKSFPFMVDKDQPLKHNQKTNDNFLVVGKYPVLGMIVCLRVVLPLGGRGHIYGKITSIEPLPTDQDLEKSDSALYGKGCPCKQPGCPVKNGTREEMFNAYGSVHGHEITVETRLSYGNKFEKTKKLRYPPIEVFFRKKSKKYSMKLRFHDKGMNWKVVGIKEAI
jgi:hypothetical protein